VVVKDPAWIEEGAYLTCVRPNEWAPEILKKCDIVLKLGRGTITKLDEGMQRIAGYAAYVAGTKAEMQKIRVPKVDLFKRRYPLLTDVMSGRVKGRTNKKQRSFFLNDGAGTGSANSYRLVHPEYPGLKVTGKLRGERA
jgi:hypothetical protein